MQITNNARRYISQSVEMPVTRRLNKDSVVVGVINVFVKRVEIKVECNILIKICVNERGTNNAKKLV